MAGRFLSGCFCGKEILPKIAALPAFSLIFSQLFTHTLGRRAIKHAGTMLPSAIIHSVKRGTAGVPPRSLGGLISLDCHLLFGAMVEVFTDDEITNP
jgi:hypothetical protein